MIGVGINLWQGIRGGTVGAALGGEGGDSVAPILSLPTGVGLTATSASVGVTTDTGEGVLYMVVSIYNTPPTKAQVKLGQDYLGVSASYADNQAISSTGVKSFTASGLTDIPAPYFAYFMHEDVAHNQSSVSASAAFYVGAYGMLYGETQGLAIDFQSTDGLGSVSVIDTGTPSNNRSNVAVDTWLTNSGTSPKLVMKADGTLGWTAHNLLLRSQGFDNASWTKTNVTATADTTVAPDGTTTADTLQASTTGSSRRGYQAFTTVSGAAYTFSVYLKAGTAGWAAFELTDNVTKSVAVWVNLATGALGTTSAIGGWSLGVRTAVTVGSFWRVSVTTTVDVTTTIASVYIAVADNSVAVTAGDNIIAWGAQLNRGSTPTAYLATTTAARFATAIEYSGGAYYGLVEPAATNLALYASDFTNAAWTKVNLTAAKTATGPDAVDNSASTLTATAANGYALQAITSGSAARITHLYVKRRTGSGAVLVSQSELGSELTTNGGFDADTNWTKNGWVIAAGVASGTLVSGNIGQTQAIVTGRFYTVTFTLSGFGAGTVAIDVGGSAGTARGANGTYTETVQCGTTTTFAMDGVGFTGSVDNISVKEINETSLTVTSSWTWVNSNSATVTNPTVRLRLATNTDAIDVALFDHETGAVPTSPIETFAATVTRAKDSLFETAGFPLGSAYTIYIDYKPLDVGATSSYVGGVIAAGGASNYAMMRSDASETFRIASGGSTVADMAIASMAASTRYQVAARVKLNDFSVSANGGAVVTDGAGALPVSATTLELGTRNGTSEIDFPMRLNRVIIAARGVVDADLPTWRYTP